MHDHAREGGEGYLVGTGLEALNSLSTRPVCALPLKSGGGERNGNVLKDGIGGTNEKNKVLNFKLNHDCMHRSN